MRRLLACAMALLLSGCAWRVSLSPTVYVDTAFGARTPEVIAGLESWAPACSHPSIVMASAAEILTVDEDNAVTVIMDPGPVPVPSDMHLPPGVPLWGLEHREHIALDFQVQDIQAVAAHEFGHALGLVHIPSTKALMYPEAGVQHVPQCLDYAELHAVHPEALVPASCP